MGPQNALSTETFLASLLASGQNGAVNPDLKGQAVARKARGLFGGNRPTAPSPAEAYATLMQSMQQQQQPARYGVGDRVHDFFATYNGAPTRYDALQAERRQDLSRQEANQFGASFGALAADTGMEGLEERQAEMRRLIALRQAQGLETGGFERMANDVRTQGYNRNLAASLPNSLPPAVSAAALVNPAGASAFAYDQNSQDIIPGGGGSFLRGSKATGPLQELRPQQTPWEWVDRPDGGVAPRPGGPADPDYVYSRHFSSASGETAGTPAKPVDPLGTNEVMASVLMKAREYGVEALTPAEKQMFDYATTRPEPAGFGFPMPGMMPPQQQPAAAPRQSNAGGPARPQTQAEFDRLPRGAQFINPADGALMVKE